MTQIPVMEYLCHKWPRMCSACRIPYLFFRYLSRGIGDFSQFYLSCLSTLGFLPPMTSNIFALSVPDGEYSRNSWYLPVYYNLMLSKSNKAGATRVSGIANPFRRPPVFNFGIQRSMCFSIQFSVWCFVFLLYFFGHCIISLSNYSF